MRRKKNHRPTKSTPKNNQKMKTTETERKTEKIGHPEILIFVESETKK